MKTECIYIDENNQERILYIDELVTTEYVNGEVHYMNNNSRLFREVRRASREHRLFCTCGCQGNLQLVAGDNSITTRRFFRNYTDFANINCCYDESPLTQKSKILLRAWLNQTIQKHLLDDIPIAEINKGSRRYELTYYSQEYDFGLVYANEAKNIPFEKIQELDEYKEMQIMYISDIHNRLQSGQLPVHQIDMQDKQGYCTFLKVNEPEKDSCLLSDARLVCIYYIRQYLDSGVWIGLPILEDCILEFSVSPEGKLFYKNEPVDSYRNAVKEQYIAQVKAQRQEEETKCRAMEAAEPQTRQQESTGAPIPTEPAAIQHLKTDDSNNNYLKYKVKRIIEKRLETYNNIVFDVNTDWLSETTINGSRCIVIDLHSLDAQTAQILAQIKPYTTGTHKSIQRTSSQIIFQGYD